MYRTPSRIVLAAGLFIFLGLGVSLGYQYVDKFNTVVHKALASVTSASRAEKEATPIGQAFDFSERALAPVIAYPIQISGDQRHLIDDTGAPIVLNGDTPWSLAVQLTRSEVEAYLDDRVSLGLNAIMFNLIEHKFGDKNPEHWTNQNGSDPFSETLSDGSLDFTTQNENYWVEIDWILEEAESRGIVCLLVPAYVGWKHSDQGWAADIAANEVAGMRAYGEFLGARYSSQDNIIWVMGGDWGPVSESYDLGDEINALAQGIKSEDSVHLMTAHDGLESAIEGYDESWLDLNNTYAYGGDVPAAVKTDWERQGPVPFFYIEGRYENEGPSPKELRAQYYQAILGGGSGHLYGASNVWYFDAESGEGFANTPSDTWQEALDYPGAQDLANLQSLLRVREVTALVPDYNDRLITSGGGGTGDPSYAPCSVRSDRRIALCYLPSERSITVDLGKLTGESIQIAWYNPAEGTSTIGNTVAPSGQEELTPPGTGDWILLLDDTGLGLSLPNGSAIPVELTSFTAVQDGGSVRLEWETQSETNNAGFAVERRIGSTSSFRELGFVSGEGTSSRTISYHYVDSQIPDEVTQVRYRLRQVDKDGSSWYSEVISLSLGRSRGLRLRSVAPNPARNQITVHFDVPEQGSVRLEIFDVQGRRVAMPINRSMEGGAHEQVIDVQGLAAGRYFLRLQVEGKEASQTFSVVH